jgi:hypothetical protein
MPSRRTISGREARTATPSELSAMAWPETLSGPTLMVMRSGVGAVVVSGGVSAWQLSRMVPPPPVPRRTAWTLPAASREGLLKPTSAKRWPTNSSAGPRRTSGQGFPRPSRCSRAGFPGSRAGHPEFRPRIQRESLPPPFRGEDRVGGAAPKTIGRSWPTCFDLRFSGCRGGRADGGGCPERGDLGQDAAATWPGDCIAIGGGSCMIPGLPIGPLGPDP